MPRDRTTAIPPDETLGAIDDRRSPLLSLPRLGDAMTRHANSGDHGRRRSWLFPPDARGTRRRARQGRCGSIAMFRLAVDGGA
jgi:hypothetical protein